VFPLALLLPLGEVELALLFDAVPEAELPEAC
jgi:hypothetical protein